VKDNRQMNLFDNNTPRYPDPTARKTDPITSHLAAMDARLNMSKGRTLVLSCLSRRDMTDYELATETGFQQNSIGKRRGECMAVGYVTAKLDTNNQPIKRPAPSGSKAIVWCITPEGRKRYQQEIFLEDQLRRGM